MMADTIFEAGLWPTFCILTKTRFSRFFYFVADISLLPHCKFIWATVY